MQGRSRFLIERVARDANIDTSQPIAVTKLVEAIQQARDRRMGGMGSSLSGSSTLPGTATKTEEKKAASLVPGFGAEFETSVVLGFGEPGFDSLIATTAATPATSTSDSRSDRGRGGRGDSDRGGDRERGGRDRESEGSSRRGGDSSSTSISPSTSSTVTASTSAPATTPPSSEDRVRGIARAMLNQYDTNKDGTLQRDEWSKMSNEPEKADKNGDGQISLDEMTDRLSERTREGISRTSSGPSSSTSSSTTSGGAGGSERGPPGGFGRSRGGGGFGRRESSRPSTSSSGNAYRFLTPTERLPEGLPSEFTSKDRDGDGQVSMAEFSSTWNNATLAQFNRWDLNGDGWVTPAECLAAERQ
jgi:Ca2+-binding EF-hand superfamily protein